jgi:hypothetical protein
MNKMRMLTAKTLLVCGLIFSAPLLLTSCASDPEVRVVTETQTVIEQVEVYRELPANLTAPVAYPAGLDEEFTVDDMFDLIFGLYDALDQANNDKVDAGELTAPAEVPQ